MDWNLKATSSSSWDFTEFEQESTIHNNIAEEIDGSSKAGIFSVDLKLGGDNNNNNNNKWKEYSKMESSSSSAGSSSKRARAVNIGAPNVSCLVDGCNYDLNNCRDYHRRHKVCEHHSKTPQVLIGGQKQRFCQQCSRFHCLEEFDEGKRSCRKRLDGHNRRRRKPQPDPLSRSGGFLTNYQGTQILSFSSSHVYPSTTVMNPNWTGVVNTDQADHGRHYNQRQQQQHINLPEKQNLFLGSSPSSSSISSYKGSVKQQFTFLHGDINSTPEASASVCQLLLRNAASAGSHSMFPDSTLSTRELDCALSLLSSPQTQTSGIGMSHIVQQPFGRSLHNHSLEPMDGSAHGMFHMRSDNGSSASESPQTIPFQWE